MYLIENNVVLKTKVTELKLYFYGEIWKGVISGN